MDFTTSAIDQSYDSLENLYTKPAISLSYQLKVAALALFLFVSSMNAQAYDSSNHPDIVCKPQTELVDYNKVPMVSMQLSDVEVKLGREEYRLIVREMSDIWQRQLTYEMLLNSFKANFEEDKSDIGHFIGLFQTIANELSQLMIKDSFVDVSRKKDMIDFNLNMTDGLFLSVAKMNSEKSDNVMFTIARNQQTLVIDEMPLGELMKKLNKVEAQMKNISRS